VPAAPSGTLERSRPSIDWWRAHAAEPSPLLRLVEFHRLCGHAGTSAEDKAKRKELFRAFDVNGNGFLSLAEVDKGIGGVIKSETLFSAKKPVRSPAPAVRRSSGWGMAWRRHHPCIARPPMQTFGPLTQK